jgi:hypothetical protein
LRKSASPPSADEDDVDDDDWPGPTPILDGRPLPPPSPPPPPPPPPNFATEDDDDDDDELRMRRARETTSPYSADVADERERDKRLQGQSDLEDAAAEEEEWWAAEVDAMVRSSQSKFL